MTSFGIDISHWQGDLDLGDLLARNPEIEFVMAKMSEGKGWRDDRFLEYRAAAEKAGVLFAGYHYVRADAGTIEQAQNAHLALDGHNVPVFIDLERTNGKPQPKMEQAVGFKKAAEDLKMKVSRLLYLPEWYWMEIGQPRTIGWALWQSDYANNDGEYPGDKSSRWETAGTQAEILQFTSKGRLSGYSGDLDINAYRGTREELARTGWFKDYQEDAEVSLTKEDVQNAVATTPIAIGAGGETQPLQKVLRRLLNRVEPSAAEIAEAVVKAIPDAVSDSSGAEVTQDVIEKAVANVLRKGTDSPDLTSE